MRGRKPAPTSLKLLKGTQPCRINQDEPELAVAAPYRPKHLSARAKQEWDRLLPELLDKGVLTVADGNCFAEYCDAVAEIELLKKKVLLPYGRVRSDGRRSAWTVLLREASESRRRCEIELGLTPSARTRVKAINPKKAANPFDSI